MEQFFIFCHSNQLPQSESNWQSFVNYFVKYCTCIPCALLFKNRTPCALPSPSMHKWKGWTPYKLTPVCSTLKYVVNFTSLSFLLCVFLFIPCGDVGKNERRSNMPCMPCVVQITNLALHIQLIIDVLRPDETTLMNCNEEMLYLRKVFVCYED